MQVLGRKESKEKGTLPSPNSLGTTILENNTFMETQEQNVEPGFDFALQSKAFSTVCSWWPIGGNNWGQPIWVDP